MAWSTVVELDGVGDEHTMLCRSSRNFACIEGGRR